MSSNRFLEKLSRQLFAEAQGREAFEQALLEPKPISSAVIWLKERPAEMPFAPLERLEWQADFVDRVPSDARPGAHPLHEQGAYYCLDFSSVFSASVMLELKSQFHSAPSRVFDVCSAPGGKGIFAWRALRPELLLCNEVIGKRTGALISNLKRCHVAAARVISMDSSRLAEVAQGCAELVIVDAPCSGQSLIAKGETSPGCFHPATINMNSNRQKRILANSAKLLAPGAYMAYMTCTYSRQENEGVVEWLRKKFPAIKAVPVSALASYQSHLADFPCYRMWPQGGEGAGAFAVLLQNVESGESSELDMANLHVFWKGE